VNRLSQHLTDPTELHYILQYLQGIIDYLISYVKGSNNKLVGYSDAAYGNSVKQCSTSGYVFTLASGPVSWSSRKQPITAISSSEAEYITTADAAKQAIWLCHFLYLVRNQEPTTLFIDNTSAIKLSENPVMHSWSKHIMIWYHAICDFNE
jgi:hypothetical protein